MTTSNDNASMQQQIADIEQALANEYVSASAEHGLVTIEGNGTGKVTHVFLDPSLFTQENRQSAEDLIRDAYNQFQENVAEKSRSITVKFLNK